MNESFPRILYNCPKVDSMKALEAPNSAMTHIQKIAPGPPIAMAVDLIDDTAGVFIDRGGNRTPFNVCIICYLGM